MKTLIIALAVAIAVFSITLSAFAEPTRSQPIQPPPGTYPVTPFNPAHPPANGPITFEDGVGEIVDPFNGHALAKIIDMAGNVTYQALVESSGTHYRIVWWVIEVGPPPVYYEWTYRVDVWDPDPEPDGTWTTVKVESGNLL